MYQSWGELLFVHWPVLAQSIRPLIPEPLSVDTHEGVAWIGLTPFTMGGVRPVFAPSLPLLSESHELNVRTYVHLDGVPGVWFFSLDANNRVAVLGARLAFHLPYFGASMSYERRDRTIRFTSRRPDRRSAPAEFEAAWRVGDELGEARPGSLDFFLVERYCLYSAHRGRLCRARIFHRPWTLRSASLLSCRSTMLESQGLPAPGGEPLRVRVWPRIMVRETLPDQALLSVDAIIHRPLREPQVRRHNMKLLARGTLAGLVGTALMTAAMLPSKKASMSPGKVAPRQITENLLNRLRVRRHLSRPAFEASWVALHFGYGTVSGVDYALGQRAIGRERPVLEGLVFGMALWAVGYCGWLPLAGLYPPPTRLPKREVGAELIATHLIYGVSTAAAHRAFVSESDR